VYASVNIINKALMKNRLIAAGLTTLSIMAIGCGGSNDTPGSVYMPDMAYSRAYETYSMTAEQIEELQKQGIFYNSEPVPGTIARGEMAPYKIPNDSTGYAQSASVTDPLGKMDKTYAAEAERLYMVNCAICHGDKLDGNGPLWKGGDGPYPAAPRNLLDDYSKGLADGTMYHVITYGKGLMGSYAAQVSPKERWMLVKYIRNMQSGGKAGNDSVTTKPAADSTNGAAATTTN
jgi:mono/diheme cytochrome c family protein